VPGSMPFSDSVSSSQQHSSEYRDPRKVRLCPAPGCARARSSSVELWVSAGRARCFPRTAGCAIPCLFLAARCIALSGLPIKASTGSPGPHAPAIAALQSAPSGSVDNSGEAGCRFNGRVVAGSLQIIEVPASSFRCLAVGQTVSTTIPREHTVPVLPDGTTITALEPPAAQDRTGTVGIGNRPNFSYSYTFTASGSAPAPGGSSGSSSVPLETTPSSPQPTSASGIVNGVVVDVRARYPNQPTAGAALNACLNDATLPFSTGAVVCDARSLIAETGRVALSGPDPIEIGANNLHQTVLLPDYGVLSLNTRANYLPTPPQPRVTPVPGTGSLPAGTYFLMEQYRTGDGHSLPSPEVVTTLSSPGQLEIGIPDKCPRYAGGVDVAISTDKTGGSGAELIDLNLACGSGTYTLSSPISINYPGSAAPPVFTATTDGLSNRLTAYKLTPQAVLVVGDPVSGPCIPPGATITEINPQARTVTLSEHSTRACTETRAYLATPLPAIILHEDHSSLYALSGSQGGLIMVADGVMSNMLATVGNGYSTLQHVFFYNRSGIASMYNTCYDVGAYAGSVRDHVLCYGNTSPAATSGHTESGLYITGQYNDVDWYDPNITCPARATQCVALTIQGAPMNSGDFESIHAVNFWGGLISTMQRTPAMVIAGRPATGPYVPGPITTNFPTGIYGINFKGTSFELGIQNPCAITLTDVWQVIFDASPIIGTARTTGSAICVNATASNGGLPNSSGITITPGTSVTGWWGGLVANYVNGTLGRATVTSGGSGYTSNPNCRVIGHGHDSFCSAVVSGGKVTAVAVSPGYGWFQPTLMLEGGGGAGASATVQVEPQITTLPVNQIFVHGWTYGSAVVRPGFAQTLTGEPLDLDQESPLTTSSTISMVAATPAWRDTLGNIRNFGISAGLSMSASTWNAKAAAPVNSAWSWTLVPNSGTAADPGTMMTLEDETSDPGPVGLYFNLGRNAGSYFRLNTPSVLLSSPAANAATGNQDSPSLIREDTWFNGSKSAAARCSDQLQPGTGATPEQTWLFSCSPGVEEKHTAPAYFASSVTNAEIGDAATETIASAATIAPKAPMVILSGDAAIAKIEPPRGLANGCFDILAAGSWSTAAGGNIRTTIKATPNSTYRACYFGSFWYIK
jgi:hypothetical protein